MPERIDYARPVTVAIRNSYGDAVTLTVSHSHYFAHALRDSNGEPVTYSDPIGDTVTIAYPEPDASA